MALLSKSEILNANDSQTETVSVPEWGGDVLVSTMSGFARDQFEASIIGKNGGQDLLNIRAKMVAATLVDESGGLMFTEKDISKLGKKSAAALDRVFAVAQKLNRFSDSDVEELAKN
ncbi:MAG: hypothetical protein OQK12_17280 [Motiliproteus sp.]|nr:hypothetical protein [Motiliproteus sp.]MCW9051231.1 hypothetical protein [Motiliproteus sp.]